MDNNTNPQKEEDNIGSFYMGRMRPPPEPKRLLPPGVLTVIILAALGGVLWYAYPRGAERYADVDVPVVKADTAPIKAEPTDPGGMEVRHQDSTVFDPLEKKQGAEVEKLLPTPEEPMNKDEAIKPMEAKPPVMANDKPPQLDLQMKEAGNGIEKVEAKPDAAPAPAPVKPQVDKAPAIVKKDTEDDDIDAAIASGLPEEESAAVAPAAKAERTAAPKAETKSAPVSGEKYEVQLGSYRETADLKKDWERLRKKYSSQLGSLKMRAVKANIPGKGIYYRLQAGTLSKEKAQDICSALKSAKGVGCLLAKQ